MTKRLTDAKRHERSAKRLGLTCFPKVAHEGGGSASKAYPIAGQGEAGGLSVDYVLLGKGESLHAGDDDRVCAIIDMGGGRRLAVLSRGLPKWKVERIDKANAVLKEFGRETMGVDDSERRARLEFATV